jgi:hypothetical protein
LTNPLLARVCAETLVVISAESILNPSEGSERFGGFRHYWDNRWDNFLGSLEPLCFENLNLPTYLFRGFRRFRVLRQKVELRALRFPA